MEATSSDRDVSGIRDIFMHAGTLACDLLIPSFERVRPCISILGQEGNKPRVEVALELKKQRKSVYNTG